jgi:hypothetical protein
VLTKIFFQVHCVLLYSIDGTFKPPHSKAGAFSRANWGDYEKLSKRGAMAVVKRATVFLTKIQGLSDHQWDDIYMAALENNERAKQVDSAECVSGEDGVSADESEDDDELFDPLYDDIPEPY